MEDSRGGYTHRVKQHTQRSLSIRQRYKKRRLFNPLNSYACMKFLPVNKHVRFEPVFVRASSR